MTASIIDGKAIAAVRTEVAARVRALAERGVTPGLAAVLVGDDQASRSTSAPSTRPVRRSVSIPSGSTCPPT